MVQYYGGTVVLATNITYLHKYVKKYIWAYIILPYLFLGGDDDDNYDY